MDLFAVFPQLLNVDNAVLRDRKLRLISLAGLVYDEDALYCELGEAQHWGRASDGSVKIGVGTPKVQPTGTHPAHRAIVRYVRLQWCCQVTLFPSAHSYLLDENGQTHVLHDVDAHTPYLFIFTAPRLGGGEVPDALVQAVYLLPTRNFRTDQTSKGILRVSWKGVNRFLEPRSWSLADITEASWAELILKAPLPRGASLTPVLALRGLRRLFDADVLPGPFGL